MFPSWGPIRLYGLLTFVGFVISACYLYRALSAIPGVRRQDLLLTLLGGLGMSEIGGALLPYLYLVFTQGYQGSYLGAGRWFHSAFLSVFLYGLAMAKLLHWPVKKYMDQYMIAAMLMSAIGRIGCLLNGCCEGKDGYPTQLIMFGIEMGIFFLLRRLQGKQRYDGQTFWTGVWIYSAYRLWIETLRTNPVALWGMTAAQLFSLAALLLASALLFRDRARRTGS